MATLTLTQVKSPNGSNRRQLDTLRTLGLGRIGKTSQRPDDATVLGAIRRVEHLVEVSNG